MARQVRRVARYVDALLRDRRPPRLSPDEQELGALRQANAMSSLRPSSDSPNREFVTTLRRRLEGQMDGVVNPRPGWSRRVILQRTGAAAGAVFVGVAVDRAGGLLAAGQPQELEPDKPAWLAVGKVEDVSYASPLRFHAGGVEGFVFLADGRFRALSAVCTHQGCLLRYNPSTSNLECPCHGATFSSLGTLVSHKLLTQPRPLPSIAVRLRGGNLEVRVG